MFWVRIRLGGREYLEVLDTGACSVFDNELHYAVLDGSYDHLVVREQ